jgi:hypothetical protein
MEYSWKFTRRALSVTSRLTPMLLVWGLFTILVFFTMLGFFTKVSLAQTLPSPTSISYHRTFQGTVHTYPITMYLVINQNDVNGYYYYDRVREPLYFSGTVRNDGTMNLAVNAPADDVGTIESFVGRMTSDNAINGTWVMLKNNKKLAFSVKENPAFSTQITIKNYQFERCAGNTEDDPCVTVDMSIPEIRAVNAVLSNNIIMDIKEHLCEDAYMKTAECFLKSLPDLLASDAGIDYGSSVSYYIFLNQVGILSSGIEKTIDWSSPRPSSETTTRFMNYSIKTGQKITTRDMFMPGTLPFIENLIKSKISAYLKQDSEENEDDVEIIRGDLDNLKLDTSISIAPYALVYHYPYYHYAGNGYTDIMLPYNEIKRWINPNGPLGFVK